MSAAPQHHRAGRMAKSLPLVLDAALGALSFVAALYLRLAERTLSYAGDYLLPGALSFALVLLLCLLGMGAGRRLWRYVSLSDLMNITRAGLLAILVFYVGMFVLTRLEHFPRSVVLIHFMTLMLFLTAPRVLWRLKHDRTLLDKLRGQGQIRTPVMLIGAGRQAEMFIRESLANPNFPYRVVALVDDDARHHGRELHHVRIYGRVEEAGYIVEKLARKNRKPQRLIFTEPALEKQHGTMLLKLSETHRISLARMPSLSELASGKAGSFDIRPVAVEDILGRPERQLDLAAMRALIASRRVLITGAGGSIGSELTRQIAAFAPAAITLYECCEFNLYSIDRALAESFPTVAREAVLGDVRDRAQLDAVFTRTRPEIVFHAAALKHVPLCEHNPDQAVRTNVWGSAQVAECCTAHGVALMVQVSTDKAVNPLSVMGTTKRVAEMFCQALAASGAITRFCTVRFGNVLNSAGSVVPLFTRQIQSGGPVTITHADMTRYFMTIAEAVELVLQAAALTNDESSAIYVLEMGAPVRIEELARQMIRLSGLKPDEDIAIAYTGLRPGEKLYEELFHEGEAMEVTAHPSIRRARARVANIAALDAALAALYEAASSGDGVRIRAALQQIVPEFRFA